MDASMIPAKRFSPRDFGPAQRLFLASFLALFLELLLIRWAPSLVRVIAYYGNLMLLSSFLGLGCGVLLAPLGLGLRRWFAPFLLLLILMVSALKGMNFQQGPDELRFLFQAGASTTIIPVAAVFALNTLVFVPLGELIGSYFQQIPPLKAYTWDLGGAIAGTVLFGVFSYVRFSPLWGFALVMGAYLVFCQGLRHFLSAGALFLLSLGMMWVSRNPAAIWSPYNHITVREIGVDGMGKPVIVPPKNIGTMRNPPSYVVQVNNDFYMISATIDPGRYDNPGAGVAQLNEQYLIPHRVRPGAREVLVVGSGGGVDVEAALLAGADRVDAAEIDPVIIWLGKQFNGSQSYNDPRVSVYNVDARAFFRQTDRRYDLIVFGFLDSQGLFSQMSSIRLDGYVYTRESFREAFALLKPGGVLSVSFFSARQLWLLDRLVKMVQSATGSMPLIYTKATGQVILLAGKGVSVQGPDDFRHYRRFEWKPSTTPEAIDDWPYLYLRGRFIPRDYLMTMGFLLGICFCFVFFSYEKKSRGIDLHFFFLGAGFLLLETKSITTLSLGFGTTWIVSMLAILGVLLMVLSANLIASRFRRFSLVLYLPLIASVVLIYIFPTQTVLGWSFASKLVHALVLLPLPIFFAGLIFSSTFRDSASPSRAFGSNLLGAMAGGFTEYLGMATGTKALLLVVLVFYLASFLVKARSAGQIHSRFS